MVQVLVPSPSGAAAAATSIVSHHASVRRHACSRAAADKHQKRLRARAAAAARADEHSGTCAALMAPCVASHGRAAPTRQALLTAQAPRFCGAVDVAMTASLAESAVAANAANVVSSRADLITHERTGQPFARGALINCQHCRQAIGEVAATLLRIGATLSRWLCTGDCLQARQVACGVLSVLQLSSERPAWSCDRHKAAPWANTAAVSAGPISVCPGTPPVPAIVRKTITAYRFGASWLAICERIEPIAASHGV